MQRDHKVLPATGVDGMVRKLDVQFSPDGRVRKPSDADSVRDPANTLGSAVQPTVADQVLGRNHVVVAHPPPLPERKTELPEAPSVLLQLLERGWLPALGEPLECGVQFLILPQERIESGLEPIELVRPHAVMIADCASDSPHWSPKHEHLEVARKSALPDDHILELNQAFHV